MRHGEQLAPAAYVHIARAIGERRVEQRDVGIDRGQHGYLVSGIKRIVDDLPVRARCEQVAADQSAQGDERQAFLPGLKRGMHRRAGRVEHADATVAQGIDETVRRPEFAQRHRRGFNDVDGAGADQYLRLQPADGHAYQVQAAHAAAHEFARGGHGHAAIVRGDHEFGAVGYRGGQVREIT